MWKSTVQGGRDKFSLSYHWKSQVPATLGFTCLSYLSHIFLVYSELLNLGRKVTSFSEWTIEWLRSRFYIITFLLTVDCPPCNRATRQLNLPGYDLDYHTKSSCTLWKVCKDTSVHHHTNHPSILVKKHCLPSYISHCYFVWDTKIQFFLVVNRT